MKLSTGMLGRVVEEAVDEFGMYDIVIEIKHGIVHSRHTSYKSQSNAQYDGRYV